MKPADPLGVLESVFLAGEDSFVYRLDRLSGIDHSKLARRPRTVRILLENLVRRFDPARVDPETVRALAEGRDIPPTVEIPFHPARVLLQDFTGIPTLVDLATLRNDAAERGLDPKRINPVVPVDLIVDHSVQVDSFGTPQSLTINLDHEYERNGERYRFLGWARGAFSNTRIVPPGNGICHQVNLEYLASVVQRQEIAGNSVAFPDTLIGTDSHTTMVNGVSVLGWGVGGIEAEAVMLGEPYFLADPIVVGVELIGSMPEGATAMDLTLTITRRLRERGVVDQFVEFFGPGVSRLAVPDRATISNMCPEYGATAAFFPIDEATIAYLHGTGRDAKAVARVEAYAKLQELWGTKLRGELEFDDVLTIDLGTIVPTISGPGNPQESMALSDAPAGFARSLAAYRKIKPAVPNGAPVTPDGSIVIAAITSCTNTSNPSVMFGAGLIAQRALALGLRVPPYVKTSLAPGSKVVTDYLQRAGLLQPLTELGFGLVGFGCTTCIGNSGPLPPDVAKDVAEHDRYVAAVLSGNRNFEARIHNQVRANYLASPMLVVAYALAGRMDIDLTRDPIGKGPDGAPVRLRDLWPTAAEIRRLVEADLNPEIFREKYRAIEVGDLHWESLDPPKGDLYAWDPASTYLQAAPYLHLPPPWIPQRGVLAEGARALLTFGDQISTDHISPAGAFPESTPAGRYLLAHGVPASQFNTYGTRRGDHEVMVRGTFANVRLKNQLLAPKEGGWTAHLPEGDVLSVYDAAERYRTEGVPLIVLAGKSYGQGSSRDWAAKGPRLLGIGAVAAESFERIHRTNLIEMGVLPLRFAPGQGWKALGLTGRESFRLSVASGGELSPRGAITLEALREPDPPISATLECAIHSPIELEYYLAGGVLPYVMTHRFAR